MHKFLQGQPLSDKIREQLFGTTEMTQILKHLPIYIAKARSLLDADSDPSHSPHSRSHTPRRSRSPGPGRGRGRVIGHGERNG